MGVEVEKVPADQHPGPAPASRTPDFPAPGEDRISSNMPELEETLFGGGDESIPYEDR
jgi:hypothetical protein